MEKNTTKKLKRNGKKRGDPLFILIYDSIQYLIHTFHLQIHIYFCFSFSVSIDINISSSSSSYLLYTSFEK